MPRSMKLLLLAIIGFIASYTYGVSRAELQQQTSPNHSMVHFNITLENIVGETFDNVTVTMVLPGALFYMRDHHTNSGSASVDGQTITWKTGDSSVSTKHYHFFSVAHQPGTFNVTAHVTDNQGVEHTYTSNDQSLAFPRMTNGFYTVAKNGTLALQGQDLIVNNNSALDTTVVRIAIQPNAEYGTAVSTQLTTPPFGITYTPDADFVGYDYFLVQAFDANGDGNGKSVFIAVEVENDPESYPSFLRHLYVPKPISPRPITRNFALSYPVGGGDIPIHLIDYSLHIHDSKRPFVYTIDATGATHGSATCTPEGEFRYQAGSETGTDTITYRITDANGFFCDATITIEVVPFSD